MKFRINRHRSQRAGFTLAEVLAALLLMALVIPVAVEALHIASRAGVVAQRKAQAARVGERVMNEIVVSRQWNLASQTGIEKAGPYEFRWTLHNQPWNQLTLNQTASSTTGINQSVVNANTIHELSIDVVFSAQNQDYSVHLTTLVDVTQPASGTSIPQL